MILHGLICLLLPSQNPARRTIISWPFPSSCRRLRCRPAAASPPSSPIAQRTAWCTRNRGRPWSSSRRCSRRPAAGTCPRTRRWICTWFPSSSSRSLLSRLQAYIYACTRSQQVYTMKYILVGTTYDARRRWAMPRSVDSCWTTTWLCLDFWRTAIYVYSYNIHVYIYTRRAKIFDISMDMQI